jgi:hypothetical protein
MPPVNEDKGARQTGFSREREGTGDEAEIGRDVK